MPVAVLGRHWLLASAGPVLVAGAALYGLAIALGWPLPAVLTWRRMYAIKTFLAAIATVLLLWDLLARRSRRPDRHRRLRGGLLIATALLAAACWWNLFQFHFRTYVHTWDIYHHYMGAKYFRELGYSHFYRCSVVADDEDGALEASGRRRVRDLDSNRVVLASSLAAAPEHCTARFTPERWEAYRRDVAWFRAHVPPGLWEQFHLDHGFNASPAWVVAAGPLAGWQPASRWYVRLLSALDPALLLAMWGAVIWAFGWRAACVAGVYWGTNYPADFGWTGGAYLRQVWLAASVIGLCLLKRGRPIAGGFALGVAAPLRIFPALLFVGPALRILRSLPRGWRAAMPPATSRLVAGAAAALLLLGVASTVIAGGWRPWPEFARNTIKHASTPLTNAVGLPVVISYDHGARARLSAPLALEDDPFQPWKEAQGRARVSRQWIHHGLLAAFIVLLAVAVRRQPDWSAAVLAAGLVPMATALTSYYSSLLLVYGLLAPRYPVIGIGLVGLAAATSVVPEITSWNDERFALVSLLIAVFVALATARVAFGASSDDGELHADPPQVSQMETPAR